jgi:5-methylcytosine-specific restriction endonuclease McrA
MPSRRYEADKRYSEKRKSHPDQRFLQTRYWRDCLRPAQLRKQPLCEKCSELGRVTAAEQVDHIKVPNGDYSLQRDPNNLRSLCASCHALKTRGKRYSKEVGLDGMPIDPNHPFYEPRPGGG